MLFLDIEKPTAAEHDSGRLLVMFTISDDEERILDGRGAGGYLYRLDKIPAIRVLESLREVVDGGTPISPAVARRLINLLREGHPPAHGNYRLTPHEIRLLTFLVEGHTFKTVAVEAGVSPNTIAWHMRHIYEKLQVHSKAEAVAKALREGLT